MSRHPAPFQALVQEAAIVHPCWPGAVLASALTWAEFKLLGWIQLCAGVGMPETCSWVCFPRGTALVCWMEDQMFGKLGRAWVGYRCYNRVP